MSTDHRGMRISDAERERVVAQLNTAVSEGRLTLAEFEERVDGVLRSRTYGDIEPYVMDLPVEQVKAPEAVEIRNRSSSLKRQGRWTVPRRLTITTQSGSVKLDFTEAIFGTPVVDIELDATSSSVELVLPAGAVADVDSIDTHASTVRSRIEPSGGGVHFRISGEVSSSSVKVRYQRRFWRWRW
ncbi:DUF1707 domain-containing protein [Dactylosporangium aurantiacum]|uniref:DUF1707 domain-containing protein n=1 Tax=Dactylosporangium aurantiacum TaxID=35754 RepID=A0A9Q9IE77_9ACTN|nr:DUF1707 domain-containing protein [Dactylosporangium aurantiacum]MDG6101320.1 DUF1707 domain-containing protein [Dactylosporangium aurantiacum]UWZ54674.1 DUF1707 domain-containing protein [Dactylosporangium aurantiacum]